MKFSIDLSQLLQDFELPKEVYEMISQRAVESATWAVYEQLHREANNELRQTRQIYKRNINKPVFGRLKGTILLTGALPNMVEQGAAPFDEKPGFQKSRKVKKKKDGIGWYMTIPFRWATPGAIADSEAFSNQMPDEIYEIAKGLTPRTTDAFDGVTQSGEGLPKSALEGTEFGVLRTRPAVSRGYKLSKAQKAAYKHKSPIYQGIYRNEKTYEVATQSTYVSFRRVSDKSDVNSWIHTGIEARNLMPKAVDNAQLDAVIAKVIHRTFQQLDIL